MDMIKVTAKWSNFQGAPGYSTFYFAGGGGLITDSQQVTTRVVDAFAAIQNVLPLGVGVEVQDEVELVDSDTGMLTGYETVDGGDRMIGTGTGTWSAASGAVVNWGTNDVRFGRRIRGRTFIVPIAGASYDSGGTLASGAITKLQAFGDALTGVDFDSEFGVWSRPRSGTGGVFASVTSYRIPDMAAVLRSRRD